MNRRALGKGLEALIPSGIVEQIEERKGSLLELRLDEIRPNPDQPRRVFDEESLSELAESIRSSGVLQPLLVRDVEGSFELIAGERRYRAARLAGVERVPVVVHQVGDEDALKISLVENLQRDDLNPIEEAHGYKRLVEEFGLKQKELGEVLGRDRTTITNSLRLLKLSPALQQLIVEGALSAGHGRALLALDDETKRQELARRVHAEGLSVRELEELTSTDRPKKARRRKASVTLDHDLLALRENLERHLGTHVRLVPKGEGGSLAVRFENRRDLERIAEAMGLRFSDF